MNTKPLKVLPVDFQINWTAWLHSATPNNYGAFHLVDIRRTKPGSFEEGRITVLVLDENGLPMPSVPVAFAFSTAKPFVVDNEWEWVPPAPRRAFIVPTEGGGQIDQIQGNSVKPGQPGGVTVYIFDPQFPSDFVSGMGMLPDHTGVYLTFQQDVAGVKSWDERLDDLEERVRHLEARR